MSGRFNYTLNTTFCDDSTICPYPNNQGCCAAGKGIKEIVFPGAGPLPTLTAALPAYYEAAGYVPSSTPPSTPLSSSPSTTSGVSTWSGANGPSTVGGEDGPQLSESAQIALGPVSSSHPTTSVSTAEGQDSSSATGSSPIVSSSSSNPSSSSTPVGAIVGGVVGGVTGLAISAALVYFAWMYHRLNKRKALLEAEKLELPHESPQHSVAPRWPTFQTLEVYGTDPDVFKPRELDDEQGVRRDGLNWQGAEAPSEIERPVDIAKELPGVPIFR